MRARSVRLIPVALCLALLVGCSSDPPAQPQPFARSVAPEPAPAYDATLEPAEAVLALVPQSAAVVTVTDWDQVRVQLGQPDLTSEDLASDRAEFWRRAETEAALLTGGLLRDHDSELWLDYDFTSDDVDWEARFTSEDGPGFVLGLRPDLDLDGVRRAVADGIGPLADAELDPDHRLLVSGTAEFDVWAHEDGWAGLVDEPATATYLHRGCIPMHEALGPDADVDAQQALLAEHPASRLEELPGFAIGYGDHQATLRVEPGRGDLFERLRIGEDWPVAGFPDHYVNGAADPATGRVGYTLPDPPAAAALALLGELPFGICDEVELLPEPTGL